MFHLTYRSSATLSETRHRVKNSFVKSVACVKAVIP